jgi:RNA polymerase sigma factor (sigma-70 family)
MTHTDCPLSDDVLVARLRSGDPDAFAIIHVRYRRPLLDFARHRLGARREEAEDLLQDALIRAYRALLADDRPIELRPWLYRIVANRVVDELRRPLRAIPTDISAHAERLCCAPTGLAATTAREELADVVADVIALPVRQREALVGQALDGVPHEQLAERLGTTVAGSKALVNRARVTLLSARRDRARAEDLRRAA